MPIRDAGVLATKGFCFNNEKTFRYSLKSSINFITTNQTMIYFILQTNRSPDPKITCLILTGNKVIARKSIITS